MTLASWMQPAANPSTTLPSSLSSALSKTIEVANKAAEEPAVVTPSKSTPSKTVPSITPVDVEEAKQVLLDDLRNPSFIEAPSSAPTVPTWNAMVFSSPITPQRRYFDQDFSDLLNSNPYG